MAALLFISSVVLAWALVVALIVYRHVGGVGPIAVAVPSGATVSGPVAVAAHLVILLLLPVLFIR